MNDICIMNKYICIMKRTISLSGPNFTCEYIWLTHDVHTGLSWCYCLIGNIPQTLPLFLNLFLKTSFDIYLGFLWFYFHQILS